MSGTSKSYSWRSVVIMIGVLASVFLLGFATGDRRSPLGSPLVTNKFVGTPTVEPDDVVSGAEAAEVSKITKAPFKKAKEAPVEEVAGARAIIPSNRTAHPLLTDLCNDGANRQAEGIGRPVPYGTRKPLPRVAYKQMHHTGKMIQATLCAVPHDPLRMLVILDTADVMETQVAVLTREAGHGWNDVSHSYFQAYHAIVLIVAPAASGKGVQFNIVMHTGHHNKASSVLRGEMADFNEVPPPLAGTPMPLLNALLRSARSSSDPTMDLSMIDLLAGGVHHVFQLPDRAVFTPRNLKAVCYFEAALNNEAESVASYPLAEPFAMSGSKDGRRVPLGLVYADFSDNPQLTIVTSCRVPFTLADRHLNPNHYSKGGEMVVRGSYRCAALRCTGGNEAVIPFMLGVQKDVLLYNAEDAGKDRNDQHKPHSQDQREQLFVHRRPHLNQCSPDPANDPTRLITHIPYMHEGKKDEPERRGIAAFHQTLMATAKITAWSDTVITTNTDATTLVDYAILDQNATTVVGPPMTLKGVFPATRLSELVIVSFKNYFDSHQPLAALSQWHILSNKGFYDISRYTESDISLITEQFDFFCATLPTFNSKNYYLNFIRFETPMHEWEKLDAQTGRVWSSAEAAAIKEGGQALTVRRALPHPSPWMIDNRDSPTIWPFPYGNTAVELKAATSPALKEGSELQGLPLPKVLTATTVSTHGCAERIVADAAADGPVENRTLYSIAHNGVELIELPVGTPMEGCHLVALIRHPGWSRNSIYNAMFMVPDSRVSDIENRNPPWRHWPWRENVAYFESPAMSYAHGVTIVTAVRDGHGYRFPLSPFGAVPHNGKFHEYKRDDRVIPAAVFPNFRL